MKNIIFTINGKRYKKIDKRIAERLYNDGTTVYLNPANVDPINGGFFTPVNINDPTPEGGAITADLSGFHLRAGIYTLINCNAENGRYINFYAVIA